MATWKVWGERYETSDMSNTRVFQPIIFHRNTSLLACKVWLVFYNNPVFTSLNMKIYSNDSGSPGQLLSTSTNIQVKADIFTNTHAMKEVPFTFDYPEFMAEDTYHFVVNAVGYTGDSTSHIAWRKGFPNPVYKENVTLDYESLLTYPYEITFIGSEIK